jgi:tRNA A-37 threonylcarbamoyl transferase component Bud32
VLAIGDVIRQKYRLLRLLGDGGMGSVYEASHELLGTRVAIKVLHAELARRTGLIDRFMQEARVAAQIKSTHVVQVTDIDRTPEGVAYIVMELLEGEALSAMLDRQGKLPIATACDFAAQILEALEAAHALGVVHRDLKPENVFVTYPGTSPVVKLIDFGIAKLRSNVPGERSLTVAGVMMGTAEYMAPEQAFSADKVDGRSDLYAVGVLLYEMIAGKRPVSGEDARTIAMKVERGEATPLVHVAPEVPREIAGLVHRAMAARPELRFESATAMRLALEGARSGKRAPTVPLATHRATVQAEPMPAAFDAPAHHVAPANEAPPRTERAPGVGPFTPMAQPAVTAAPRPRKSGRGGTWALIVGALLLGAGVVVAVVVSADRAPEPTPTPTLTASPPAILSASPPPLALGAPGPTDSIAPLAPSPRPSPASRPGDGSRAPHAASATPAPSDTYVPPPFQLPTFPSGDGGTSLLPFPIPSAFPTAFPTAFPGALPTTFPSALPFPLPAPEAPSSPPAASATPAKML